MTNIFRSAAVILTLSFLGLSTAAGQTPANELDAFMAKVLARRKVNQDALKDYVLNDLELFEAIGPGEAALFRGKREYLWYVRDGFHVRSPLRFNGVTIDPAEKKEYEDKWIRQEQAREKRRAELRAKSLEGNAAGPDGTNADTPEDQSLPDPSKPSFITQISEPRFISEAYFLDFKFESGNYYLVGKEKLDGRDVLIIEYYPTKLFNDDKPKSNSRQDQQKEPTEREKKRQEKGALIDRQMNKTSLVTLWVDPAEHQIVKYDFSNVWMDFLPAGWLLRVDHLKASMEMSQAIPGVWLPRNMSIQAGVSLAVGLYTVRYERKFSEYKRAEVTTTIRPIDQEKQ